MHVSPTALVAAIIPILTIHRRQRVPSCQQVFASAGVSIMRHVLSASCGKGRNDGGYQGGGAPVHCKLSGLRGQPESRAAVCISIIAHGV